MTDRERDEQTPRHVEAPNTIGTLSGFGANQVAGEIDRQPTDRRIHAAKDTDSRRSAGPPNLLPGDNERTIARLLLVSLSRVCLSRVC